MINCKEVIVTQNDESTCKLEFVGCKFTNNGKEVEGNIVFPKVLKTEVDAAINAKDNVKIYDFASVTTDDEPEIFTIYVE